MILVFDSRPLHKLLPRDCATMKIAKTVWANFFSENLGLLAYQIAEHKGKKGQQLYRRPVRIDYWMLFTSSMGGGLIISFCGDHKKCAYGNLHFPSVLAGDELWD